MNKRLKKFLCLTMITALSLSLTVPTMAAKSKEEAQKRIEELKEEKAALEDKLSDLKSNRTTTEGYITELDQQLSEVTADITDINEQIEVLDAEIAQTEIELEEAKKKEAGQYEVLKLRIKNMYEKGEVSYLDILLKSDDISTVLNNAEYISKISDFDNNLLDSLKKSRAKIAEYEVQLNEDKAVKEEKKTELETKQEEINTITDAKRVELSQINASIDGTEGDISDIEEDLANENEILEAIATAEAQAKEAYERLKKEAAAKASAAAQSVNKQSEKTQAEAAAAKDLANSQKATADQAAQDAANAQAEADRLAQEQQAAAEEAKKAQEEAERKEAERIAAEKEAERIAAEKKAAEEKAKAEEAQKQADEAQKEADQKQAEADEQKKQEQQQASGGLATGSGNFSWPLPGYTQITSPFGSRICPFHGPENHNGIDIPAPGGTKVLAADSGVVTQAAYHYSLGNYIVINHGNGYSTWYLHNSSLAVSVGTNVSKGQVISYVGTTGSSTGNHLDFRVMDDNGNYYNPLSFVTPY